MATRFLTARWSHLAMLNYAVPESALTPYLPPGCEPDLSLDGRAYCSMVFFDFVGTRVLGLPIPGFRRFSEINLRLYVRRGGQRGVVFVSEIVPQRIVAAVARLTYNEPYSARRMSSRVTASGDHIDLSHELWDAGRRNTLHLTAGTTPTLPPAGSAECFFKDQQWGFGKTHGGRLIQYEVVHKPWRCFDVKSWTLDWNFENLYGPRWSFLAIQPPASVFLMEGSDVEVFVWKPIRTGA